MSTIAICGGVAAIVVIAIISSCYFRIDLEAVVGLALVSIVFSVAIAAVVGFFLAAVFVRGTSFLFVSKKKEE